MKFLKRWKNTDDGFTLLEVVIVLALVSSLTIMSLGSADFFEKRYIESAAQQLKSDIQYIQGMELNASTDYIIVFISNGKTHGYNIYKESTLNDPIKRVRPSGIKKITVSNTSPSNNIEFTKRGTTATGAAKITLFTNKYSQVITTYLGTGYVSIDEVIK